MSCLTKMHFALYDANQRLMVSSSNHDRLLSVITSNSKIVKGAYSKFVDRQLKLSLARQEPFFVQSLTEQYHAFIPLQYDGRTMTVLVEAFYTSMEDFKRFYYSDRCRALDIPEGTEEDWLKDIRIYSSEEIVVVLENIRSVLQALITAEFDNDKLNKYIRQSRNIVNIMSDLNSDYSVHNIYQIVIDTIISLFEIDTAAILVKKDGQYLPEVLEGRNKSLIRDLSISDDDSLIRKVRAAETSVSKIHRFELLHRGFPEDIYLMTTFPFASDNGMLGILAIFNSSLDDRTYESITNICRLMDYLCEIRRNKEELEAASVRLNVLSLQASSLYSPYRDRSLLYESIVSEASCLADAEKCSLMMPDDNEMMEVRAARGINGALMANVRVRQAVGIPGKVYEHGLPIMFNSEKDWRNYGDVPQAYYESSDSLTLPLKLGDEMMGVLNLSDKRSGRSFTQSDISTLSPFILQASALLKLEVCQDKLAEMKKLSMTDSLTGLFNRRYFDIRLEEEFLRAKRYNLALSLAIIDIDDFKSYNDTEGHVAGDGVLEEVSFIMSSSVRSYDILARFGGEEFAVIMPQTSKSEAFQVSERIRENVKCNIRPTWKTYHKKQLTICSGVATYPECGSTKEAIIRCADKALYQAKNLGKDRAISWE